MAKLKKDGTSPSKSNETPPSLTLHQKLIEVRKQVPYLQKSSTGHKCKYGKGSVLLGMLRPKLDEFNILLSYEIEEIRTDQLNENTAKVLLKYVFTFTDAENPSDSISKTMWTQGTGHGIQDFGGYNTYMLRYFLLGFFNIPTDEEDPDSFEQKVNDITMEGKISEEQIQEIENLLDGNVEIRVKLLKNYGKVKLIDTDQFDLVIRAINRLLEDGNNKSIKEVK